MLLIGCAWGLLASFAVAPDGPWLRYDASVFSDACVAPDHGDRTCRTLYGDGGEAGLSASAALLPLDAGESPTAPKPARLSASAALLPLNGRQPPSAPKPTRLRYELAGLLELDREASYQLPRRRPGR